MQMVARKADAIFYNGRVYSLDPEVRVARAIAVDDGRIIAVGTDAEIKSSAPRGCDKYDLGGKIVIPGFIDSHTHFVNMGIDSMNVDLFGCKSMDDAMSRMKSGAKKTPEGEWVLGAGWMESRWDQGRFITKDDLDSCCPNHPAVAHRICGHLSTVNTRAISVLEINADMPGVEKSASGALTGVLKESAVALVRDATAPDANRKMKGLVAATRKAHSLGVTSVQDNGETEHLSIYQTAERADKLGIRIWFNVPVSNLDAMRSLNLSTGLGSERLKIGGLKIFCDGALGARTASLSEAYNDDSENTGMFVLPVDQLDDMIHKANDASIQLVVHAIGDKAIETVIDSMEDALECTPRKNHRHRIEHLELPTANQLKRMRLLGIIASMQPNFVGEWGGINGMYYERLGPDRAIMNNPFKDVLKSRVKLVFGSDCMPLSPMYGIISAVNAPHDSQRITAEEATAAYTRDAAYASFEENIKGTITEDKFADFVVLSGDPFSNPSLVRDVSVLKTIMDGEVVYDGTRIGKKRS